MVVSYHYFVIFAEFLGDGLNVDAEQLGHCFLCQPECLISIIDVDTHIAVLVLIEYNAVLFFLYFVFLHCSFAKLHSSHRFYLIVAMLPAFYGLVDLILHFNIKNASCINDDTFPLWFAVNIIMSNQIVMQNIFCNDTFMIIRIIIFYYFSSF